MFCYKFFVSRRGGFPNVTDPVSWGGQSWLIPAADRLGGALGITLCSLANLQNHNLLCHWVGHPGPLANFLGVFLSFCLVCKEKNVSVSESLHVSGFASWAFGGRRESFLRMSHVHFMPVTHRAIGGLWTLWNFMLLL